MCHKLALQTGILYIHKSIATKLSFKIKFSKLSDNISVVLGGKEIQILPEQLCLKNPKLQQFQISQRCHLFKLVSVYFGSVVSDDIFVF